ncbi:MAG: hypothetical protein HWE21_17690 [Cytophagia bacterium]|nr:hypothetical protein [Cytophagia bacterium]
MKIKVQILLLGLLVLALICSPNKANSQELVYEGFMRGKKVGELVATREVNDENTRITLKTNIEAHMLVKITVELHSESMYTNQSLVHASSISKVHGNVKSDVQTVKKGDFYEVQVDGDVKTVNHTSLVGADIFYFEEPKNINSVYALAMGEMLQVEKGEANVYYFEHDGKKEYHKYIDGILHEVEISHTLYTMTFKLKK